LSLYSEKKGQNYDYFLIYKVFPIFVGLF